jgi:ABC-type branched-subunit amino acid transport system ATPase component/ABC-type branched-subunit amino acid transport system permease subunit
VLRAARNPGVVAFAFAALCWVWFAPAYWVFDVTGAIPIAMAGLGLLVLQGWAREITLASAGLYASSMYVFGWLNRPDNLGQDIPWVPAAVLTVAAACLVMAALAGLTLRLPAIYVIVVSLGVQGLLEKLVFAPGRFSGGISGGTELGIPITNPRPWFLGLDLHSDRVFYWFSLAWLALVLTAVVRFRHSPAGLAVQLVGADRQAAATIGISPLRHRLAAFTVCGALTGAGGVLSSWFYVNPPVFTNYLAPQSLLFLAIPVLAGRDAIAWVPVVAVLFQVVPLALESWHINTFLLAGVGLGLGSLAGSRGIGGRVHDLCRDRRVRAAATEQDPGTAQRDQAFATIRDWLPAGPAAGEALRVEDLQVAIGGVQVLAGATLNVPVGALVGLIGPNGAGKTTLFDVVTGLRPPDSGRVELFGADITETPGWRRARNGLLRSFQLTRVVEDLTVADNLRVGATTRVRTPTLTYLLGTPGARRDFLRAEQAARAMARLLGIEHHWGQRAEELEFSARRRLDIGRALLAGPRLLLLDEPAAGLDPDTAAALFTLIADLHRELELTVLLVEHHVTEVLATCSLIHVLAEGHVIASGTPAQVRDDAAVRETYLGDTHATSHDPHARYRRPTPNPTPGAG